MDAIGQWPGRPERAPALVVRVDQAALDSVQAMLRQIPGGVRKVTVRAINKVAFWARTRLVRELGGRAGSELKPKAIRGSVTVHRATGRARPYATVRIRGRGIPAIQMQARQLRAGVRIRRPAAGMAGLIEHAFIQTMPRSGYRGVFLRMRQRGAAAFDPAIARMPIREVLGPSLAQIYRDAPDLAASLLAEAQARLAREIVVQAGVFLDQYAAAHPFSRAAARASTVTR